MAPELTPTGLLKRFAALFIDVIVLNVFIVGLGWMLQALAGDFLLGLGEENLWYVGFIILGIYFVPLNSTLGRGQTVGKRIMKIRVVCEKGAFLTIPKSFIRYSLFSVLTFSSGMLMTVNSLFNGQQAAVALSVFIGTFIILGVFGLVVLNKERRGLHDYLVKTVVIDSERAHNTNVSKLDGLDEGFKKHKSAFSVIFVLSILASVFVSFFPQILEGTVLEKGEVDSILNLGNELRQEFKLSNLEIKSWTSMILSQSGGNPIEKSLLINGYVPYSKYKDKDATAEMIGKINEKVKSSYPFIEKYNNVKITIRTGYNTGITSVSHYMYDVFPVKTRSVEEASIQGGAFYSMLRERDYVGASKMCHQKYLEVTSEKENIKFLQELDERLGQIKNWGVVDYRSGTSNGDEYVVLLYQVNRTKYNSSDQMTFLKQGEEGYKIAGYHVASDGWGNAN